VLLVVFDIAGYRSRALVGVGDHRRSIAIWAATAINAALAVAFYALAGTG
jgi:hypothetical protein